MGFGASPADLTFWADVPIGTVLDRMLNYESLPADHDSRIGQADYVGVDPFTAPARREDGAVLA